MRTNTRKYPIMGLITLLLFTILSSCTMPTTSRAITDGIDMKAIAYTKSSLTLAWDYDEVTLIDSFQIYTRAHGSTLWTLRGTTLPTTTEFTIDHSVLGDGNWDFAVSSVNDSTESEKHSSTDHSAIPETGWYVQWISS